MKHKKSLIIMTLAAAGAVLALLGLLKLVGVYESYRADMLDYESRHLNSIVSTSARGLTWMMDGCSAKVESFLDRYEFRTAEENYLATGDASYMQQLVLRPDVLQFDMAYSVGAYAPDGAFLGASDTGFPSAGTDVERFNDGQTLRLAANGVYWFVFRADSDRGLYYELALPVQTMFSYHANVTQVGVAGYLFLIDRDAHVFSYSGASASGTGSIESMLWRYPAAEEDVFYKLAAAVPTWAGGYTLYHYDWGGSNLLGDDQALVVTCPVTMGESGLVIGAAVNVREFSDILNQALGDVAGGALLAVGSILILLTMAAMLLIHNRRNAMELEVVKERADLMEEINRQQQSLARTERLQQLGVMTSGIAHEFNNLLTPIMGQSLLLLEGLADQEDSPQFENALDIYEAAEKARGILKGMSAMSKKDAEMSFRSVELGELLQTTLNLAAMAKDPHIQTVLTLPGEPLYVSGDARLLTQAFLNLCINACQAMGGAGTLTIRAAAESRSGLQYARVEVMDTGPGIPETVMGSMYDPFYTTKGEQGTGLGLMICGKIVETHKGTITAGNRPGGGAVFTVRLPMIDPPEEP